MNSVQDKYRRAERAAIAAAIAAEWGVDAPFPSAPVGRRYRRWAALGDEIARRWRALDAAPLGGRPGQYRGMVKLGQMRDRMPVPKGYVSWEHIGRFLAAEAEAAHGLVGDSDSGRGVAVVA